MVNGCDLEFFCARRLPLRLAAGASKKQNPVEVRDEP
jgi:hypothetical protein